MEVEKCKKNVKLYSTYKVFSAGFLFCDAIMMMFFLNVKQYTAADIMLVDAIYYVAFVVWQLFMDGLIQKLGPRLSCIIGNVVLFIALTGYTICGSIELLIAFKILSALGWAIKAASENCILFKSLKYLGKAEQFSKYEGSAVAKYFYFNALSIILAGYFYLKSPYIPMVCGIIITIVSVYISLKFEDIEEIKETVSFKLSQYLGGIRMVLQSRRLRIIYVLAMLITGIIAVSATIFRVVLIDMELSADIISYIICGYSIIQGIGFKVSYIFQNLLKNRLLTYSLLSFTILLLVIGIIAINPSFAMSKLTIIIVCLVFMALIQGVYKVAIKKYSLSFTDSKTMVKVTSMYSVFENVGMAIGLAVCSAALGKYGTGIATIIICAFTLLIGILLLKLAKARLGLKLEEYDAKDINYMKIN